MAGVRVVTDGAGNFVVEDCAGVLDDQSATNRRTLLTQAITAYQANKDYLAIGTPTQAQAAAQVAALTRQINGILRVLVGRYDATT